MHLPIRCPNWKGSTAPRKLDKVACFTKRPSCKIRPPCFAPCFIPCYHARMKPPKIRMLLWRNPLTDLTEILAHNLPKRTAEEQASQIRIERGIRTHTVSQSGIHEGGIEHCWGCQQDMKAAIRAGRTGQKRAGLKQQIAVGVVSK